MAVRRVPTAGWSMVQRISVADSSSGIAPERIDRSSKRSSTKDAGNGLGLFIAHSRHRTGGYRPAPRAGGGPGSPSTSRTLQPNTGPPCETRFKHVAASSSRPSRPNRRSPRSPGFPRGGRDGLALAGAASVSVPRFSLRRPPGRCYPRRALHARGGRAARSSSRAAAPDARPVYPTGRPPTPRSGDAGARRPARGQAVIDDAGSGCWRRSRPGYPPGWLAPPRLIVLECHARRAVAICHSPPGHGRRPRPARRRPARLSHRRGTRGSKPTLAGRCSSSGASGARLPRRQATSSGAHAISGQADAFRRTTATLRLDVHRPLPELSTTRRAAPGSWPMVTIALRATSRTARRPGCAAGSRRSPTRPSSAWTGCSTT